VRINFLGYEFVIRKIKGSTTLAEEKEELIRQNKILEEAGYPKEMWKGTIR